MRSSFIQGNTRLIALAMLLVWVFTLGAGIANACVAHGLDSKPLAPTGHAGAASAAMQGLATASGGTFAHAPASEAGDHDAVSHLARCQPEQAPARKRVSRQPVDKSFDLDAVVAPLMQRVNPARAADRRASAMHRPGPVVAALPLFIRFRRLIP